jgi:hypothetical protein
MNIERKKGSVVMVKIKCMLIECNHFNLANQECSKDEIELDCEGLCISSEVNNNCHHIIGTLDVYRRPCDETANRLVFASSVAGNDPEYSLDEIDKFKFCPNCGKRLF